METLGSLVDKLTIVQLKQYHTGISDSRQDSLQQQNARLQAEISEYLNDVITGVVSKDRMTTKPNKVHYGTASVAIPNTTLAEAIAMLADVNCGVWHLQEKIYNFSKLAPEQKDDIIHKIAVLNLQRNDCIYQIDMLFKEMLP